MHRPFCVWLSFVSEFIPLQSSLLLQNVTYSIHTLYRYMKTNELHIHK